MAFGKAPRRSTSTYEQFEREARLERMNEEVPLATASGPIDFRNSPKSVIDAHLREIAIASGDVKFFTRREIAYLPELIAKDEELIRYVSGTLGANTWLIALTNRRIILVNVGLIYGVEHKFIPLDKVNAISGKEGMLLGKIFIRDGAGEHMIENVQKQCVGNFVKAAQIALDSIGSRSPGTSGLAAAPHESRYDKIEKLFRLKEIGAISDAEFQAEKTKLLG